MSRKKKENTKSYRRMSILTFASLLLIIWEMFIFRKTFIHFLIPFCLFIFGGLILFFFLRKKINYYIDNQKSLFLQAIHGVILFGGTLMFLFMALNYYIPTGKVETIDLKILETGNLARGRRGCGNPYAEVDYHGFKKQLIFPCNTIIQQSKFVEVSLKKGTLGFLVVKEMKVTH